MPSSADADYQWPPPPPPSSGRTQEGNKEQRRLDAAQIAGVVWQGKGVVIGDEMVQLAKRIERYLQIGE